MPQISIIVPIYKVEKYLSRCIDSILKQTFTDFELILVDDGSPDSCGVICDKYAKKDSRIRVIHQKNGGLASARNSGLKIAVGEYIMFCDSDDYVSPNWCQHLISKVKKEHDNMIFGGINVVEISEEVTQTYVRPEESSGDFELADLFLKSLPAYACNNLFYADVLKKNNICFPTSVIIEDLPFNLDYLRYMTKLTYAGFADYFYVQDERETLSRKYYSDGFRKWREKYQAIQKFIVDKIEDDKQESVREAVANNYTYRFFFALNATFDKRNEWNILRKLHYNSNVVKSSEFQHCLQYADVSKENRLYIYWLKHKNYYFAHLIQLGAKLKRMLKKGS